MFQLLNTFQWFKILFLFFIISVGKFTYSSLVYVNIIIGRSPIGKLSDENIKAFIFQLKYIQPSKNKLHYNWIIYFQNFIILFNIFFNAPIKYISVEKLFYYSVDTLDYYLDMYVAGRLESI